LHPKSRPKFDLSFGHFSITWCSVISTGGFTKEGESVNTVINYAKVLLPAKHVLLLSHMRSNSSLVSHLIGSNPQVSGYYEMHIGYYSWKSLYRQKLKYMEQNPNKPFQSIFFDKVLHDDHHVSEAIVNHPSVKLLFSIREPFETVVSTVKLYKKNKPEHEYATYEGAIDYYIQRANSLSEIYQSLSDKSRAMCFRASAVRDNPTDTLAQISEFMKLKQPLSESYTIMDKTGARLVGDNSKNIFSGKVLKNVPLEPDVIAQIPRQQELLDAYQNACQALGLNTG
jgi:hypothetical protein